MVNSKTKVKNRQLLRSRITQQILLSISKITPGSGRVDGSPDCAEKHKGSSSTAITTSRQNTLLAHLAIVDQLISSYPVSCTCVCFQPYPPSRSATTPSAHAYRSKYVCAFWTKFSKGASDKKSPTACAIDITRERV